MAQKISWVRSLFTGIWTLINVTRKLILNLIFFAIVIVVLVAIGQSEEKQLVRKDSALLLDLTGRLVIEEVSRDPLDEFLTDALGEKPDNPEILVRELVSMLKHAQEDERIKALILDLEQFEGGGLDKMRTVASAIDAFKTSGKPVYAVGDSFTQEQYYLAAHADHIYLNPMGAVLLQGYGSYPLYFKALLDKLLVTTHVFRVGTYKSAVEPYMRTDMSPEAKVANSEWLNAYWSQYKQDVAVARGIEIAQFDETLDAIVQKMAEAEFDFARYALDNQWVDALKTRAELFAEFESLLGAHDNGLRLNLTSYQDYRNARQFDFTPHTEDAAVAVVVAKGNILPGNQKPGTIGGDSTAQLLRKARLNDEVKAVVLHVDSPGGSAFASEIIRQEVLALREAGKPVVASMSTYAASGGYWISASADKIVASPSTITGSIGVFGLFMTYEKSFDYLGIHSDGVGSTELTGLSPLRPLDDRFSRIIQGSVEHNYKQFINIVAQARGLTTEAVDKIAQGRVWIGEQALSLGLIDQLGGVEDAITLAAELAELTTYRTEYIERSLSPQELFWRQFFGQALSGVARWQFGETSTVWKDVIKFASQQVEWLNQFNDPKGVYAYCLPCQLR